MLNRESTKTIKDRAMPHSKPFGTGRDKKLSASVLGEAQRKKEIVFDPRTGI
jgi:hypothetical protein